MISRISYSKAICQTYAGLPGSPFRPAWAVMVRTKTYKASRPFRMLASQHDPVRQEHAIQNPSDIPFELVTDIPSNKPSDLITGVRTTPNGESVTVEFHDATFTFHTQWLHDARVDNGPAKDAVEAFLQNTLIARIRNTRIAGHGVRMTLIVTWNDGCISQFPAIWLRVYAPLVAKRHGEDAARESNAPKGWLRNTVTIPEISYAEIFPGNSTSEMSPTTAAWVYDALLHESAAGIVKVVGLPAPVVEDERNTENTLVTRILKQIFGSVFVHPRRERDTSFNIASHHEKTAEKGIALPNYNTNQTLLPHVDQSHYTYPARIQGLYALEGESENTFVSCPAVLATFREETPHLFEHLCTAPMAFGRVAHFYAPPLYQATVDTAVTMEPGFPGRVKRYRWHPHLASSLVSPYDKFPEARTAHRKFQEIMRRDTHQLKVMFKPGDLYIWDGFRLLHGRELVFKVPRTSVGQTVPEQVVADKYRVLKMKRLMECLDEKWLIHMPQPQLHDSVNLLDAWES
jgi:trimethyllysine dioxygenase